MSSNPLSNYFRTPSIYITLPSKGRFFTQGSYEQTVNNEIPVYPMSAIDEITYKTPDALFNGQAVVSVIQSCVPNIKNAWELSSLDIDSVLIAIRIASYGHSMDMDSTCPACGNSDQYSIDLRQVLDTIGESNYDEPLVLGDLQIYFAPMTYKQMTENNIIQFEEQKLARVLQDDSIDEEEKMRLLGESFRKVSDISINAIAHGIKYIKTPEASVAEYEYIIEFLRNCERNIFNGIRDKVIELRTQGVMKPIEIKCAECGNEYNQPFTLDMANFFG